MNEQEETIDLRILLKVFTSYWVPIIIATIAAAAIGFSLAKFAIPKRYTSAALMYVENSASKQEDTVINANDITAAQKLVDTCQILFTSDSVFGELQKRFGDKYSSSALKDMVKIESVNGTAVLKVSVTSQAPDTSHQIAEALVEVASSEYHRIIKGGSIETVSPPTVPTTHNYPSTTRFALIGALIGLVLFYGLFFVKELVDTKVKPDDDLAQIYALPVFAEILDFETAGKGGYKYGKYGRYSSYDSDSKNEDRIYSDDSDDEHDIDYGEGAEEEDGKEK